MVVEFLLNEIKDRHKLYNDEPMIIRSFNDDKMETIPCSQYIGKAYCQAAMETVKNKVGNIKKCEYKGSIQRIANEVFELISEQATYTVICTIDTYPSLKTRMLVQIESKNTHVDSNGAFDSSNATGDVLSEYDQTLEKVKLEVKSAFRKDWTSCVWIKDEQSEFLCSNLYPHIFRTENRLRAFANKLLIWELGPNWIESPGLEKYAKSHTKLSEDFRRREPVFSDVDDVFISATLETLFEIIQKGLVYESPFQLSQEQLNDLIDIVSKSKTPEHISNWIKKRRTTKKDLWKDIFEPYFASTKNSQQIITDFILNRNHIAHNKPLTLSAYGTMERSFTDLDDLIKNANEKFEESVPSEELYLTIDIKMEEAREAEEQEEYERTYLRDRIEGETGVEILWHQEIFELFLDKADLIYQTFHDLYYWDSRFAISPIHQIEDNENWQTLFSVKCNACEEYYLDIQIEIIIDDEMDGDSSLSIRYRAHVKDGGASVDHNAALPSATIYYHNGNGYENIPEGTIELLSESSLDESEIDDLIEELTAAIEAINPYVAIKQSMEESAAKGEETSPVADFPCCECEKYGVSLRDDFYKFGHCCYCGTDNEVQICEKCGLPFGDGGGNSGLCNSCHDLIEKE